MKESNEHRRGRGEGGIRYREDTGTWEGRISFKDGHGRRYRPSVTGETKKKVQGMLDELRRRFSTSGEEAVRADRLTLRDWADQWLATTRDSCSPHTHIQYEQHVRLYLKPLLGAMPIGRLNVL
jgi:hypothetical protein